MVAHFTLSFDETVWIILLAMLGLGGAIYGLLVLAEKLYYKFKRSK